MMDYVICFVVGLILGSIGNLFIMALFMIGDRRKQG